MFYSQFILAKKGPLGTIWIAAHLDRKLRRNQVTETNIGMSVDSILFPEVPIALRLSGHLLLGVVRIYSRKVNYLFHDCSEALVKIKQAFRSGIVDLPPEAATAPFHSITLPETFDLDEFELLPDRESSFLAKSSVNHHVTSREQITLQDSLDDSVYLDSQFGLDERFADGDATRIGLDFDEELLFGKPSCCDPSPASTTLVEDAILPTPTDETMDTQTMPMAPADDALNFQQMGCDNQHELLFGKPSCCEPSPASTTLVEDAILPTPTDETMDTQMMPMTPADDAINFQRMGCDNQHEPATPALAPDMMDVSDDRDSSTSALGAVDMELEGQIEASTTVQTLEALGLAETEREQLPSKDLELVNKIESPVKLREGNMPTNVELPSNEELRNGQVHEHERSEPAQFLEDEKITTFNEPLSLEKTQSVEENLEIEKLRSAVECKEQPDLCFVVKDHTVECDNIREISYGDVAQILDERREESIPKTNNDVEMQGVEKVRLIEETPIRDYGSSFLSIPSPYSAPSTVQFPSNNDELATILGRGTPAIRVAPTPPGTPAPKRCKSALKPSARKRKAVLDNTMVLNGDLMRQQQEYTSDIRRIRKKAPCTVHEIWAMQKEAHGGQQAFHEPSFSGLSEEIRELYHRVFGLGGARFSPASCVAYVPNHEVAHDVSVGKMEAEGNYGDGSSDPKGDADKLVQFKETVLPNLVEAESLDVDAIHSEAKGNERQDKRIPSEETINAEAAVNDLQASSPDFVVELSESEPVLDSQLVIKDETVLAVDADQPSKDIGKDVIIQVDGEGRPKEEDILVSVGSTREFTQLVDVAKEDAQNLENDRKLSSEMVSVDAPTTLLSDPQNIVTKIKESFASGLIYHDKYEHKNLLQVTQEKAQELVHEQTELPLQEAKKEVELPTHEATSEHVLSFQDKNKETHMQMEVSQMQFSKEPKNSVEEFSKESLEAMQAEDKEAFQQEPKKESEQVLDKEAQAAVQIETMESRPCEDEQVLMLESDASTLLQPKDEASAEVLEFLGDTDCADNDNFFYDEGDDFDDMPGNDSEIHTPNNSGWSIRTRAVCQYLRSAFQALDTNSKNLEAAGAGKLGIEKLLFGKTRKEAARMFFETLVLKTKDYVNVEQAKPYDDIKIFPRAKLMKTEI